MRGEGVSNGNVKERNGQKEKGRDGEGKGGRKEGREEGKKKEREEGKGGRDGEEMERGKEIGREEEK